MLWFKRNLWFAVLLLVALGLFGYGSFYAYTHWSENAEIQKLVEQADADLKKIYNSSGTFPSVTNIAVLRQQEVELRRFLTNALERRVPISFDPAISPANFKTLMDNTLDELAREAEQARVAVAQPTFTFTSIKPLVTFVEGSVPLLAEQLAEVKLICNLLFRSEITAIANMRREAVSKDDVAGVGSVDYHSLSRRTNELTGDVSSFYIVTFQGFSESLAAFLDNVQRAKQGLSVRLLSVMPPSAQPGSGEGGFATDPAGLARPFTPPQVPRRSLRAPGGGRPGPGGGAPVRNLVTLADERAFRVAAVLEVTKPAAPQPAEAPTQ